MPILQPCNTGKYNTGVLFFVMSKFQPGAAGLWFDAKKKNCSRYNDVPVCCTTCKSGRVGRKIIHLCHGFTLFHVCLLSPHTVYHFFFFQGNFAVTGNNRVFDFW
jgi:hypothetical protein